MLQQKSQLSQGDFPEGASLQRQAAGRQRRAGIWSTLFLAATMVAIIALGALLYNIIDGSFGYVAVQNKIDPSAVVLAAEEQELLAAPKLTASEDDEALAAGVIADPNAIGFFGYAYYQKHADQLKALPVNGVAPSAAAIHAGQYPLARSLFIYTTAKTLQAKPQVAAFVKHYLTHVDGVVAEVGYFPNPAEQQVTNLAALDKALTGQASNKQPTGKIVVAGSSTVFPLTQRLAETFGAAGFADEIQIDNIGTKAGFARFCEGDTVDIANASRAITRQEVEACRQTGREPLEFRVGADALAVVASQQNSFLNAVTIEQLRQIFGSAAQWSNVNAAWPATPIVRFVPGIDSGTLDFFVEAVAAPRQLQDLPKATLTAILEANVSRGLMRRFENEQPFAERTQESVYQLVLERVVERKVVRSWKLSESLLQRPKIVAEVAQIPNGELIFRSWVSPQFVTGAQSPDPENAGIRTAILGSLWVIAITLLFALPIGVGAAIYLEEYAGSSWVNRLIQTNINNLAGVPSIIYGMLGLAIFVRLMESLTNGSLFGLVDETTANGRTILSASLTLALLVLPIIIINAQEAIRAVPRSLREAGFGLGATKWQVIWAHVLPTALPGILTGNILAMSRAIGETAPLVVVGASTFIAVDPSSPFAKFTTLPVQIYQWTSRPQDEFRNIAAAAILVLLVLLLSLNASAILLRNRYSKPV